MTLPEVKELLRFIALFDHRRAGDTPQDAAERIEEWAAMLPGVPLDVAKDAVRHHFATVTDPRAYLVPAHINAYATRVREARVKAFNGSTGRLNTAVAPDDPRDWLTHRRVLEALVAGGAVTPDMPDEQVQALVARALPRELRPGGAA